MQLSNIFRLGVKELFSLWRDPMMLVLIVYAFSLSIYIASTALPEALHNAPISIVDEDHSPVSERITSAFYPPYFKPPSLITQNEMDPGLDAGKYTFALNIPPDFQRDLLAGRQPAIQLNVDATRMSQAFTGNAYVHQIVQTEIAEFMQKYRGTSEPPVSLDTRLRFNPTLAQSWFGSVMEVINNITMLSIVLTGAALIREREHGTIEHLLVMPVTPFEIMASKVWAMGLVVLVGCAFAIKFVIEGLMEVPIEGSLSLMLLSGGATPRESMPEFVQNVMEITPTTHFIKLSQAILYRGAGLDVVWPQFLAIILIGAILFGFSLSRFRNTISTMA